ncbi:MAG: hypothetical protein JRE64_22400 [Deltaproteobacteria bacterium]|nr:hypothetical protein [Deltaproteobacteria bacterium]
MSILNCLANFRTGIQQTNDYISIAFQQDSNGNDLYSVDKKEFIVTSAFLKMFICWEEFLENLFINYLIGEPSIDGTQVNTFVSPQSPEHAHKILIGTQKYVDWANHEIVRRLANIFFENGEPLATNIASISSELSDLKTIRNAAAHVSSTTQRKLDALSSRITSRTVFNISVSTLVMMLHPNNQSITILQSYQNILDISAENISRNRT